MSRRTTPSQTVGPFFSIGFSWLERTNLATEFTDQPPITIHGGVFDGDGQPVPDAVLEIWQADSRGRYAGPDQPAALSMPTSFFGFGRVPVNDRGEFRFSTIKPGGVPGTDGRPQAPHLELSIFMRGLLRRLVTRLYFPDEPANASDSVLALVPVPRRSTLIAQKDSCGEDCLRWDVHLQGNHETVFFDC